MNGHELGYQLVRCYIGIPRAEMEDYRDDLIQLPNL